MRDAPCVTWFSTPQISSATCYLLNTWALSIILTGELGHGRSEEVSFLLNIHFDTAWITSGTFLDGTSPINCIVVFSPIQETLTHPCFSSFLMCNRQTAKASLINNASPQSRPKFQLSNILTLAMSGMVPDVDGVWRCDGRT